MGFLQNNDFWPNRQCDFNHVKHEICQLEQEVYILVIRSIDLVFKELSNF